MKIKLQHVLFIIQFLTTILISVSNIDNVIKTIILLVFWLCTFSPITFKGLLTFLTISITFTLSNYFALKVKTFEFFQADFLLMPYNELFMWGFYCLNSWKLLGSTPPIKKPIFPFVIYIFIFCSIFSLIQNEIILTIAILTLNILILYYYFNKKNLYYISYFILIGFIVEFLGVNFKVWHYPNAKFFSVPIWSFFMWSNIGLIMGICTSIYDNLLNNKKIE